MTGIIYFSGTGNSKWAAEKSLEILRGKNIEAEIVNIEEGRDKVEELMDKSDKLIVTYPIYGSDMPRNLKKILLSINPRENKKAMLVCTQMVFSGDTNMYMRKVLKKNNIDVTVVGELMMSNNICSPLFPTKPLSGEELKGNLEENYSKLEGLIEKFANDEEVYKKTTFIDKIGGVGQRIGFNGTANFHSRVFSTNERCTLCGYCQKVCPVGGVKVEGGKVKWNKNCVLCARCYNSCPTQGINVLKASKNKEKYPRYKGPFKS